MMNSIRYLLICSLAILLAACSTAASNDSANPAEMVAVNLPVAYIADPQFAPLYVAVDKGYFAEEGFEVTFDYSFETDGIALVGANERPFAIAGGDQVLLARAQSLPIVYVLEWYQRFPISVVSKSATNIVEPADLEGRTVGLPGFFGASYVGYVGLLSANGITQDQVNAQEIGFTQVEALLTDQVEAVVGFSNNEPVQLANQGEDVTVIHVADYIDLVSNGLVTNEETIENNPQMVQGFVRAMLRGLSDTIADPDQAYEISKKYIEGLDDSRRDVLSASIDLWTADTIGLTHEPSWQTTEQVLLEMGFLDQGLDNLEAAFTNRFVQEAQP